jgi:hypothetical protein
MMLRSKGNLPKAKVPGRFFFFDLLALADATYCFIAA